MILDNQLVFDNIVAITTTRVSTNIIDLQGANLVSGQGLTPPVQQGRDLGSAPDDHPVHCKVYVTAALLGGTSINVQLQGAPDNGSGSPGTYYTIMESGVILTANLLQGQDLIDSAIATVPAGYALPRFLQINYVVVGTYTSGTVFAGLTLATDDFPVGPNANISGYKPGFVVNN
jgi:hypothetical protein